MKLTEKLIILLILTFVMNNKIFSHKQNVHQYMVREAYKLLSVYLGGDYPILREHVGTTEQGSYVFIPGGKLVIGAYREDEEDVVYWHFFPFYWTVTDTHFWEPDGGDGWHFVVLGKTYENAYQKARKYIFGGYELDVPYEGSDIIEAYEAPQNLFEYYNTKRIFYKGYYQIATGQIINRNFWTTSTDGFRDKIVWEILGRICHLIGDMSVPAHAHGDRHVVSDSYEDWMGSNFSNWNYSTALNQGGIIDISNYSNPLKYIFYTTAQISDFFPSNDYNGDASYGGNEPFTNYPGLQSFIDNLKANFGGASPNPFNENLKADISNYSFNYGIRMIASFLYWFAKEANLEFVPFPPPPPLSSVWISGTQDLNDRYIIFAKWTSYVSGGIAPFHYQWKKLYTGMNRFVGNDVWFRAGPDSRTLTMSRPFDYFGNFKLKCIVTDAANSTVTSNIIYVWGLRGPYAAALDNKNLVPTKTKLDKNYPNPFNPSTTIKYQLKKTGFVSLKVYDILGKEVANLVNENKSAGFYNVSFDASKLSSGLYIYRLRVNDFVENKKMLLTK